MRLIIRKEVNIVKIAVTYENGNVFQHFGHSRQFKIYDAEDGKILASQIINTMGSGHGALSGMLSALKVDTLICGGIGAGAKNALAQAGIKLYGGVVGNADQAVNDLLSGNLAFNANVQCSHYEHSEGHSCGEHKHGCSGNGGSCHE